MDASTESLNNLPLGFEDWHPAGQILAFALAALGSEDATMISASILAGTGQISRSVAFFGAFFGIWIGDFLLYIISYNCRSWAQRNKFFSKWMSGPTFQKYESWFAEKGWLVLIITRFLPGTRVGAFVTAGYLRMSFWPFVTITFSCAFVWATIIFLIFEQIGEAILPHLNKFYNGLFALILIIAAGYFLFKIGFSLTQKLGRRIWNIRLQKVVRWEFWPGWIFYTPVFIHYFWLVIKYRSLTLPTISNPCMENGGFVGESKAEILRVIHESGCPQSLPFDAIHPSDDVESRLKTLTDWMAQDSISWPIILKPDVGQRGQGVKLIESESEAVDYLKTTPSTVICQKVASGENEAGLFYIRLPNKESGFLFGITEKVFPYLEGDGQSNIEELIWSHPRAKFQNKVFLKRFADKLEMIPLAGEKIPLVFAGNHAQGTLFLDGAQWKSEKLQNEVDYVSRQIPGFYFGRYDVRFDKPENLTKGQFEIIELNGASSEATNIYDPSTSIWKAYAVLFKQWDYVFKVGSINRSKGLKPIGFFGWLRYYRSFRKNAEHYSISD